jgi:MFS family permease
MLLGTLSTGWARRALPTPDAPARPNPTLILGVILTTYLMIILDATVVITALPVIAERLDFSPATLSWVQSAYALTFGGLLLLGARMGDILGRRRTFVAGIALFTVASLAGGLAQTQAWLLAARALQGVGAAIAAPSSLALLTANFREGPERMRALAAYSAVAGGGGSVGLVLGGMLTDWISWRWGLWINIPVGAALIWLAPRVGRARPRRIRRADRLRHPARSQPRRHRGQRRPVAAGHHHSRPGGRPMNTTISTRTSNRIAAGVTAAYLRDLSRHDRDGCAAGSARPNRSSRRRVEDRRYETRRAPIPRSQPWVPTS